MNTPYHNDKPLKRRAKPTLSTVLSFRNEEDVLPELIRRLRDVLRTECQAGNLASYELIFVNDASTDRSEAVLFEAAKGHDDIKIITMSRNFGVAPCVLAGMEYSSGDVVVYMDADLQDPPEVIPELFRIWEQGDVDIVHTQRMSRAGEPLVKLWLTQLGYRILRSVSSIDLQVEVGDFKLLSRRAVNQLINLREKNPFIRGLICWIGFNQATVRYHREARFAGKTKFPIYSPKVIRNFLYSALISFSEVPLQFSSLLGIVASFVAFLLLLYILAEKIQGHNLPGWSALMVTMLFLGSAQLLAIGTLGLYINSIFLETKKRPNYVIQSTFGFGETIEATSVERSSLHKD